MDKFGIKPQIRPYYPLFWFLYSCFLAVFVEKTY